MSRDRTSLVYQELVFVQNRLIWGKKAGGNLVISASSHAVTW